MTNSDAPWGIMPDDKLMEELASMTPAQLRLLRELAENIQAGRRVWRFLAWMGSVALAVAALAFYIAGLRGNR